jgi:hypothetical protein
MSSTPTGKNKPRKPRQGPVYEAYVKAKALGELKPVEPLAFRADGSPLLAQGQVYVTRSGQKYHPAWCTVMAATWEEHPLNVLVSSQADIGDRQLCQPCANPAAPSTVPELRDFRFEHRQWQQLTAQINRQARGIADRLLAQGPSAVEKLGPQMQRYKEINAELETLSLRLSGAPNRTAPGTPDWDSES